MSIIVGFLSNLDLYSAFSFENYLHLKKLIRKPDASLVQILNRIHESQNILMNKSHERIKLQMQQKHYEDPLSIDNFSMRHKKLFLNNISFTTRFGDNCYLNDKSIAFIENFATVASIICRR